MSYSALCPAPLRELLEELYLFWEEMKWKSSPEHKEMVNLRLAAHANAMKEGYASPYVDPDNYKSDWTPIVKRI